MNRRRFLKQFAMSQAAAATFLSGNPLLPFSMQVAQAANNKTLVVIFQRGGCDGLNTVVPFGDDSYYSLRPTIGISSSSAINLDGFFGLHPSLAPLQSIYDNGDLVVMPAVQYDNASQSHFSGQRIVEMGGYRSQTNGWINRYLQATEPDTAIPAVNMSSSLAYSMQGDYPVISTNSLDDRILSGTAGLYQRKRLLSIYQQKVSSNETNRARLHAAGETAIELMDTLDSTIDTSSYSPSNGANYPSSSYGQRLQDIALLIKQGAGLQVATVNSAGGFDTHVNQGGVSGTHANGLAQFAQGIKALYTDLGSLMDDVVILTMTEFGRTAAENGSGGTDHGHASAWFAVGGNVNGGIYGDWPGLDADSLYEERYLAHNIKMQDVMSEIITRHFNQSSSLSSVMPSYSYSPIGFL